MKKFKSWLQNKKVRMGVALSSAAVALCGIASAAEAGEAGGAGGASLDTTAINSAFSTGLSSLVTTCIDLLSMMLPYALSIFAVVFICKKGMRWFKSMGNG